MRKMSLCFQDKIENTKCINPNIINTNPQWK